ncbi:hypothetical protein SNA_35525 [Streptomyces natalensis ATCC 27448]|uniref:DUF2786 domain-containing protein n=1 Tax=Streptomyces natalensis ATCC 27448 TaxID=1240678 RepID=A0A0D7CDU5_9ACTN|nr:hypothetical protein SNA_35525 [Streptomyces natalensis ATCC 27448]
MVADVLGQVRYAADGAAAEDAVEAGASLLAAAPAGWEAVSAAVIAAAAAGVAQCWTGGWQPADLERFLRREADGATRAELAVDAMAADAARNPATRTPRGPRWADQLQRLGADVWWEADRGYLDALARRRRTTRFETAYDVLAALRALARVPRITPLPSPKPSRSTAVPPSSAPPAANARSAAASRALGRIRGLLAKAEATTFAEEAEALSAKAQELMARHSIDEALLDSAAGSPQGAAGGPSAIRIGIEGPYEQAKALLLDAVATANRCQAVWAADIGFSTLIGFAPDLEATELLYTSLLLQSTTAMHRAGDAHARTKGDAHARTKGESPARKRQDNAPLTRGRSRRTRDFRQTFLVAYADRIRTRLTTATEAATTAATTDSPAPDLLPVLAARELAVEETTESLFPNTAPVRLRGLHDPAGWHAGNQAADRAHLGDATS